jgi:cytochrome P450
MQMLHTNTQSLTIRFKHELPPTAPIPSAMQTLACRWIPLSYFEWCRARYGDAFTIYPIDIAPVVFLSKPQDIHAVLTAPPTILHPGAGGVAISPIVGEHSFMLQEEEEHLSGRRMTSPAFNSKATKMHMAMVAEIVEHEIESWPLDTVFPAHPRLRSLTLKVILRTVFGEETVELQTLHDKILEMLAVTTSFVLVEPRLRHLPGWRRTWRQFMHHRHEVDALISARVTQARRGGEQKRTMLGMLLAAHDTDGTVMSDQQVRDHIMSVILAGHETTASELAWAFQLLAHNPAVQGKLIAEDMSETGNEYLTATVQEVLRHRPVFLFAIPRVVVEPIEIGGYTYHPPVQLLGCIYLMHHDPTLYPDPHQFRPERFLQTQPERLTWLPWGGGRKRCPGQHLATLEMQTVLRATLAKYTIEPAGAHIERARWRSVIVTPHAGSRIILRRCSNYSQ